MKKKKLTIFGQKSFNTHFWTLKTFLNLLKLYIFLKWKFQTIFFEYVKNAIFRKNEPVNTEGVPLRISQGAGPGLHTPDKRTGDASPFWARAPAQGSPPR